MKRFIVNEKTRNEEGKIMYYYEYNKELEYTSITMIYKGFYWSLHLNGLLTEEEIHRECFYNEDNITLGYSSDDIEELIECIEDIVEVYEKIENELIEL